MYIFTILVFYWIQFKYSQVQIYGDNSIDYQSWLSSSVGNAIKNTWKNFLLFVDILLAMVQRFQKYIGSEKTFAWDKFDTALIVFSILWWKQKEGKCTIENIWRCCCTNYNIVQDLKYIKPSQGSSKVRLESMVVVKKEWICHFIGSWGKDALLLRI